MPASEPLPTLEQLVNAYQGALVSERVEADTHDGAIHDHWAGVGAVLWRKIAARDAEEFRPLYFNSATGSRLDDYVAHRYNKPRNTEQLGEGYVRVSRASAAAGAGLFLKGTRIAVGQPGPEPLRYYEVKQNTSCPASALFPQPLTIRATTAGPESYISVRRGDRPILRLEDPLWDNTWVIDELACASGRKRELDPDYRSRVSAELLEERFGYESAIIKRMKDAGAETVVLFRSDFLGEDRDHGLNRIYVGDSGYETSAKLLRDCRLAAPSVVMAGASNQVLPVTSPFLTFTLDISFWDVPDRFNMVETRRNAQLAVVEYFQSRENPFAWDIGGVRGAVQRAISDTQEIVVTPSQAAPDLLTLFSAYPLPRYQTRAAGVTVNLLLPS